METIARLFRSETLGLGLTLATFIYLYGIVLFASLA